MWRENIITDIETLKPLLSEAKVIAVIGLKDNPQRPSYQVAAYLQRAGYKIIPIHPKAKEVLGEKVYPDLKSVGQPIDIVDIFRASDKVSLHIEDVLTVKPKLAWMQVGIENWEAAEAWAKAGIKVVMNRCLMTEHAFLFGTKEAISCPVSFKK
ncbi:MAG: CoA-binding protein [Candidatus Desulfofervidus auxilii]|nr:CoA-binding protein [Candidatus Desulfofervidus auxilii]